MSFGAQRQITTAPSISACQIISAESMVGFSEAAKCQQISKVFDDAYRSPYR